MVDVALSGVSKVHPDGTVALSGVDLHVASGELVVLLGPSGSGKTTVLRVIAGLDTPTSGSVFIGGRDVTGERTGERDVAMVFQHGALLPHYTAEANMAFGLRMHRVGADEVDRRVKAEARALGLWRLLRKRPSKMSAGERQGVALGRATARRPKLYLMDEPLAQLDSRQRAAARAQLVQLQKGLGVTTLYVTNDQTEAMALGDRIVLLDAGAVQQDDTPRNLYERPATTVVAQALGSPPMALLPGTVEVGQRSAYVVLDGGRVPLPGPPAPQLRRLDGHAVLAGVRCEHVRVTDPPGEQDDLRGTVEFVEHLGSHALVHVDVPAGAGDRMMIAAYQASGPVPSIAASVGVVTDPAGVHLFDRDSDAALWHPGDMPG